MISLSVALRKARLQLLADALGGGTLSIYTGNRPASPQLPADETTRLMRFNLPAQVGAVDDDAVLNMSALPEVMALSGGVAGWARGYDSDGNAVADFSVTGRDGPGDIKLNTVVIYSGSLVKITAGTIAES